MTAIRALLLLGALALAASLAGPAAAAASQATGADRATQVAAKREAVVIGLRRSQAKLAAFAQGAATPGSAAYRDFAPVSSLARSYGATDSTWRRVRRYLHRKGIDNAKLDPTRGFATARITQRQQRRAFPPPGRLRNLIGPVLAAPNSAQHGPRIAPIRPHAALRRAGPKRTGTPAGCAKGVGSGGFTPNQYRTAYGVDPLHARGLFGQGTRIAFVELDGFSQSALDQFARCFGFGAPRPTVHTVGVRRELAPGTETQLDTQVAATIAPMAQMDIFEAGSNAPGDLVRLYAAPLGQGANGGEPPDVISASLGLCESKFGRPAAKLLDYALSMAAGAGITVVNAAGDFGSSACGTRRRTVAFPGSSGFVTSVGGTRLALTEGNEIDSEVVWNDRPFGSTRAGGGGTSRFVHRPAYQRGDAGPFSFRAVPDVAFDASGFPGYAIQSGGGWMSVDGTSAAAPLLGGGVLLAIQAASRAGVNPPGLLNPLLYRAASDDPLSLFRDITQGDNDLARVGCCSARPGYDRASGWGSLDLGSLAGLVVAAGQPDG